MMMNSDKGKMVVVRIVSSMNCDYRVKSQDLFTPNTSWFWYSFWAIAVTDNRKNIRRGARCFIRVLLKEVRGETEK